MLSIFHPETNMGRVGFWHKINTGRVHKKSNMTHTESNTGRVEFCLMLIMGRVRASVSLKNPNTGRVKLACGNTGKPSKRLRRTKSSARRTRPRSPSPPPKTPSPPSRSPSPLPNPDHGGVVCLGQSKRANLSHSFNGLHPYISSAAEASSLIHPMMKVAHRIIASLVDPREEQRTISPLELKILYAMAHPEDNLVPHYGQFMCHKIIQLSTSRAGKICCGVIVRMLYKSAQVRAPYPVPTIHCQTMGQNHDPKLLITPDFRNPIHMTDWQIIPYIFPHLYSTKVDEQSEENEEDGDDDDEEEEEPHHACPTSGASSSHYVAPPSYHQQYMDEFQSIYTRLDTY
ncbi:unnamed protein product [Lactuca saligna]|uniref:Uncharacterized protein n=1 Tax=Lactuca saligna TaxID=75948 RepID=A0AA35YD92_LACSI|nr:unnamed protein product [Lactuca saligna]